MPLCTALLRTWAPLLGLSLLAGPALAQGTYKIGEINSYKAQPAFLEPYKKGMELAVEQVNASGGIAGRKLQLIVRDDNANPGDAVRAAEELLDGLLDVSRLDAGGLRPTLSDFDAAVLVRELAAQYTPVAAGRGLRLHVFARPAWVRSDRRLLRRVLQNFMANALRYTRSGRIVLALRVRGGQVELQVWDTGPGIPEHHMQQIFNEFHRYQQPFDWGEQGLGLGLSICHSLVRGMGGTIEVDSVPGEGTQFTIRLPAAMSRPGADARELSSTPALRASSTSGCILVIDDESFVLRTIERVLRRYPVTCVSNVQDALALCAHEDFDVILCDLMMPVTDGVAIHAALQSSAPHLLGRMIFCSGGAFTPRAQAFAASVTNRLLEKPVRPAELRRAVAEVMAQDPDPAAASAAVHGVALGVLRRGLELKSRHGLAGAGRAPVRRRGRGGLGQRIAAGRAVRGPGAHQSRARRTPHRVARIGRAHGQQGSVTELAGRRARIGGRTSARGAVEDPRRWTGHRPKRSSLTIESALHARASARRRP